MNRGLPKRLGLCFKTGAGDGGQLAMSMALSVDLRQRVVDAVLSGSSSSRSQLSAAVSRSCKARKPAPMTSLLVA